MTTATPGTSSKPATANPLPDQADKNPYLTPPDDQFWQRYSPHHEAPISATTSIFLHLAFVLLAIGVVWLGWKFSNRTNQDMPLVVKLPGGGGNPNGITNAPGIGGGPIEAVNHDTIDPSNIAEFLDRPVLTDTQVKAGREMFPNDEEAHRRINVGNQNIEALIKLNKELRDKLRDGVMPGKGERGPGSDGGSDTGKGPRKGPGTGVGDGPPLNERERKMLRWVMVLETQNAADYVKQLHGLGAIIAVPNSRNEYLVVEDLTARPAKLVAKDVAKLNRIYWFDENPNSVRGLLSELRIQQTSNLIVAFMPHELEDKLGEMELKHRGLREEEIFETKFKVYRSGVGYDVKVVSQSKK
jgi:hypothetical protein